MEKSLHIIHALFSPHKGGLEQAYINVTEALAYSGHRVTALTHTAAPYIDGVKKYTANVHGFKPVGFYDFVTAWRIRRLLKRLKPDLIIAHNARAIALMLRAAHGLGIPVCGVSHSNKIARVTRADALIVLTESMRAHFIAAGYPSAWLFVIPNFIHLVEKPIPPIRKGPVVIGMMGRMSPEKGFMDLLAALDILKQKHVPFMAHIGGDGPQKQVLETFVAQWGLVDCVRFEGWIKDSEHFYRNLDIFCLPTHQESFGIVVLEAMRAGVPVIASDTQGPASIITHGVDGLLVPCKNPEALAQVLQKLAIKPEIATNIAEKGWQRVQDYGFENVARQWDQTVRTIISKSPIQQLPPALPSLA